MFSSSFISTHPFLAALYTRLLSPHCIAANCTIPSSTNPKLKINTQPQNRSLKLANTQDHIKDFTGATRFYEDFKIRYETDGIKCDWGGMGGGSCGYSTPICNATLRDSSKILLTPQKEKKKKTTHPHLQV